MKIAYSVEAGCVISRQAECNYLAGNLWRKLWLVPLLSWKCMGSLATTMVKISRFILIIVRRSVPLTQGGNERRSLVCRVRVCFERHLIAFKSWRSSDAFLFRKLMKQKFCWKKLHWNTLRSFICWQLTLWMLLIFTKKQM